MKLVAILSSEKSRSPGQHGRLKQSPARNLLLRLREHKAAVRQPTRKIGQAVAEMIVVLINNQPALEKRVTLNCE